MAETSPDLGPGNVQMAAQSGLDCQTTPEQISSESLNNNWYIRIKIDLRGTSLPRVRGKAIAEMCERVTELHEGRSPSSLSLAVH